MLHHIRKLILLLSFLTFLLNGTSLFANVNLPFPQSNNVNLPLPQSYDLFYWPARISGWGLGGNYAEGLGDGMLSIIGNDHWSLYTDVQGKYSSDDNWFAGAGIGLREIYDDSRILGGYVFADRNEFANPKTLASGTFWFVSPGIESLGNLWDFRVNGYIPVSTQTQKIGTTFADNVGNFDFVVFNFHQQYNHLFDVVNVTGPGVDAEIGRTIPGLPNTRAYLGGYYFDPKNTKSIKGVSARINFPFNHYTAFTVADSYDNVFHNSVEAGVKLTFGGVDDDVAKDNHDIRRRMMDPIPRNLATHSRGTAQPIQRINKDEGRLVLERDNIYFFTTIDGSAFNAANGTNNCTFEHPCQASDFMQTTIDSLNIIAPNTNFYLNSGTYDFSGSGGLTINNGQSIFGRTLDYKQPASGSARPLLISGPAFSALTLQGNNIIDSIQLTGGGVTALVGISMLNARNVLISNTQIGNPATPEDFVAALFLAGDSQATVINSTLSANFTLGSGTQAVFVQDTSTLSLENSTVLAQSSDPTTNIGIVTMGNAHVSVSNSNITAINTDPAGSAIGVQSNNNSQVSISNSIVAATAPVTADPLQQNGASTITVINSRCFQNGVEVACTP